MEQFLQYQVNQKLIAALTKIAQQTKENMNFQKFKRNFSWVATAFDQHINQFYLKQVPETAAKFPLPAIIKAEITYYYWLKHQPITSVLKHWPKLIEKLNQYRSKLSRYIINYENELKTGNQQIVLNYFFAHWERLLTERIVNYQLHETLLMRQKFFLQWSNNIQIMPKIKNLIAFAWNFFDQFWVGDWKQLIKVNPNLIVEFGDLLIDNAAIKELADMLGRLLGESEFTKSQITNKVVVKYVPQVVPDFFEEIIGYTTGKSLEHLLSLETANLAIETLNPVFLKRYVEAKLAVKEFEAIDLVANEVTVQTETFTKIPEHSGPIVICIDSSKSMQGSSEMIAKSLTLAIVKIAFTTQRPCYLINFSGIFQAYDFSSFQASVPNLVHFLQHSFLGHTNINPVFDYVLNLLKSKTYKNADVLIISDFMCSDLTASQIIKLQVEQAQHHRFFALNVAPIPHKNNWLIYFDFYFNYDPRDPFAVRKV